MTFINTILLRLIATFLFVIPNICSSAIIQMSPDSTSNSEIFVLQVALQPGESLSSFDVSISISEAAKLGFLPQESIGRSIDYNGTLGNLLADNSTLRILGDTTAPIEGIDSLPEGPKVINLFEFDINRIPSFTENVDFILKDWELVAKDFSTLLAISNNPGDTLATTTVVPIPASFILMLSSIFGLLGISRRKQSN